MKHTLTLLTALLLVPETILHAQEHWIMERAVERGLARRELEELQHVGMDEKSFAKGQSDGSLLTDLEEAAPNAEPTMRTVFARGAS